MCVCFVVVAAGWAVSLSCPAVGVKLVSQSSEQVLLSAELHRLSLQMPSTCSASLTVQQILVLASSTNSGSSSSDTSGSRVMQPVLQVPAADLQPQIIQSHTRFAPADGGQQQQQFPQPPSAQAAAGQGDGRTDAATSPKPSSLGRIYHESPLSSYISHIQV